MGVQVESVVPKTIWELDEYVKHIMRSRDLFVSAITSGARYKGWSVKEGLKGRGQINGEDTCKSNTILATVSTVNALMEQPHQEGRGQKEGKKTASLT